MQLCKQSCKIEKNMKEEFALTEFYKTLCRQLQALTDGIEYEIPNLANASALLWQEMENINWAGFYIFKDGKLILGPFQGKPACIIIPMGRGVCGTAAHEDSITVVQDVLSFPGHIACDADSRSEIVLPVHKNGMLWGVLDIDSPDKGRFGEDDREGLGEFVRILEKTL